jgi:hypothetical protein
VLIMSNAALSITTLSGGLGQLGWRVPERAANVHLNVLVSLPAVRQSSEELVRPWLYFYSRCS